MTDDMQSLPSGLAKLLTPLFKCREGVGHRECVCKSRDIVELLTDRRPELAALDYSHLLLTGALSPHTTRARFDCASVSHVRLLL